MRVKSRLSKANQRSGSYQLARSSCRENVRVMSAGDSLFVPSGGAVSWRAKEDGEGEDEAVAVRFCYVDASNFNSVKSQLRLYAAVEVGYTCS